MSYIYNLLQQEEKRISNLIRQYEIQLAELPKGKIRERCRGNRVYYYLAYRNGNKVVNDYIGADSNKLNAIQEQIFLRQHKENILARLRYECNLIKKAKVKIQ